MTVELGWMTLTRVHFSNPLRLGDVTLAAPGTAAVWLFGTDSPLNDAGSRSLISENWGGAGFYASRSDAEAGLAATRAALQSLDGVLTHWTGLACVYAHRGEVNWFGDSATLPRHAEDPGGPILVMTSAGYNALAGDALEADLPRRRAFSANVDKVRAQYADDPGNLARGIYQFGDRNAVGVETTDGMTQTLWVSDTAMTSAAYHPGNHRTALDWYKAEHSADRTSFTRARLIEWAGTWDGVDPLQRLN